MSANLSIKWSLADEVLEQRKMAYLFVYIASSSSLEPFQGFYTDIFYFTLPITTSQSICYFALSWTFSA